MKNKNSGDGTPSYQSTGTPKPRPPPPYGTHSDRSLGITSVLKRARPTLCDCSPQNRATSQTGRYSVRPTGAAFLPPSPPAFFPSLRLLCDRRSLGILSAARGLSPCFPAGLRRLFWPVPDCFFNGFLTVFALRVAPGDTARRTFRVLTAVVRLSVWRIYRPAFAFLFRASFKGFSKPDCLFSEPL